MTTEELKVQSDRIMKEVNYSQHMISGNHKTIYYSYVNSHELNNKYYPVITCGIDEHGNPYMLLMNLLPFVIKIQTDKIQFNHPKLRTYINKMRRFTQLIEEEEITEKELGKI